MIIIYRKNYLVHLGILGDLLHTLQHPPEYYLNKYPELTGIRNPQRFNEKLATYSLAEKVFDNSSVIKYKGRKPYIDRNIHISIAHNRERVGIVQSQLPCGIDIETSRETILKVKSKFVGKDDLQFIDEQNLKQLTLLWTLKEAVYKTDNTYTSFKNIKITSFAPRNKFGGQVILNNIFFADYFLLDNTYISVVFQYKK